MSTTEQRIDLVVVEIGEEIGPSIAALVPADRRDFDPITLLVALGATLLGAYYRGLTKKAEEKAEELGKRTTAWLSERVGRLFDGAPDDKQREASDDARAALDDLRGARGGTAPSAEECGAARALVSDFLRSRGMSQGEAVRIATVVAERGDAVIVGGGA